MKISVFTRVMAKMVDILIVLGLSALPLYPVGPLLGFLYSLMGDGLKLRGGRAQSLGKMIFRLQVVQIYTRNIADPGSGGLAEVENLVKVRQPATVRASMVRNTPVGVATFFAIIPVWGWLILLIVGIPLMVMEVYLMATVETGHRLGDVMGDTEIVHT